MNFFRLLYCLFILCLSSRAFAGALLRRPETDPQKQLYYEQFAENVDLELSAPLLGQGPAGIHWEGAPKSAGRHQIWITYYCADQHAEATLTLNGNSKTKLLQYMGIDAFTKFYLSDGSVVGSDYLIDHPEKTEPYTFREYWGTFEIGESINLSLTTAGASSLRIEKIEFQKERPFNPEIETLLFSAIDYYNYLTTPDGFVRNVYETSTDEPSDTSSIASCGMGLMAYSINHQLGRDADAAQKVLNMLRLFNGKHPAIRPQRHRTGYRHHFIDVTDGSSKSEFSTIDTAILISGALMARNTFNDPEITKETDELWNSIDWSAAVLDPEYQAFHMTGQSIDGERDSVTFLFSEYLMLAWLCQQAENQSGESGKMVMPRIEDLSKCVYHGRVVPSTLFGDLAPSFHVQFPFYMTDLSTNELFFSYTAAQAWADRTACIEKFNDRTAWGVSCGNTPARNYSVDAFYDRHRELVVTPRIIAGFIPVFPLAADDINLLFLNPERHMQTRFGPLLPRWSPAHPGWQSSRLPGVDFSSLMFGMAAHHPEIGLDFFREKLSFTFNQ